MRDYTYHLYTVSPTRGAYFNPYRHAWIEVALEDGQPVDILGEHETKNAALAAASFTPQHQEKGSPCNAHPADRQPSS